MGLLDKILYIADYIEVRRDKADNLPAMRRLAFEDIDEALFQIVEGTLTYLNKRGMTIDPMTERTYRYLCEQRQTQRKERS